MKKGRPKRSGNLPSMCRITVDGGLKQFSRQMDAPLADGKTGRTSGKSAEAQSVSLAADKIRVEVNRRCQEPIQTDGQAAAAKQAPCSNRSNSTKPNLRRKSDTAGRKVRTPILQGCLRNMARRSSRVMALSMEAHLAQSLRAMPSSLHTSSCSGVRRIFGRQP